MPRAKRSSARGSVSKGRSKTRGRKGGRTIGRKGGRARGRRRGVLGGLKRKAVQFKEDFRL